MAANQKVVCIGRGLDHIGKMTLELKTVKAQLEACTSSEVCRQRRPKGGPRSVAMLGR